MGSISDTQSSFISSFRTKYFEAQSKLSKRSQPFGKKVENIKNSTVKSLFNTASKIKSFIKKNYINIFFSILSLYTLWHGPLRFLSTFILGLAIQKVNYTSHKSIVTSNSLALNILAIIGVILEKTICPACDPTYYLAPCISGIASSEALYNLYQNYSKKTESKNS